MVATWIVVGQQKEEWSSRVYVCDGPWSTFNPFFKCFRRNQQVVSQSIASFPVQRISDLRLWYPFERAAAFERGLEAGTRCSAVQCPLATRGSNILKAQSRPPTKWPDAAVAAHLAAIRCSLEISMSTNVKVADEAAVAKRPLDVRLAELLFAIKNFE